MIHDPIYPHAPGHRGVDTSIAAAADIAPNLGRLQQLAYAAIKAADFVGLTADELAAQLNVDRYTIQPRTSELKLRGMIRDSGLRRKNASGKRAIVWVALTADELAELERNGTHQHAPSRDVTRDGAATDE